MSKIKRFIECLIPVTACNLKCEYCYVIQRNNRKMNIPDCPFNADYIGKALSMERFGGTCYFSICGAGETLIPNYTISIVEAILKEGHFVNITTNGTLNNRFDELCKLDKELLKRLNISFSFHYLELVRLKKIEDFFENIKKCKQNGISFVLQLNLCDEYMPYLNEIKRISFEKVGAYPQVAVTRKEENKKLDKIEILTNGTIDKYIEEGKKFDSPLFEFTLKNFNIKRKEFCYAGDWSFNLNLLTGELRKCYCYPVVQNIYENIERPIVFEAIGNNCHSRFCFNSSHFMSFGVIPELDTPTYADLRNREDAQWYASKEVKEAFNSKLYESNVEYGILKKIRVNLKNKLIFFISSIKKVLIKIIRRK